MKRYTAEKEEEEELIFKANFLVVPRSSNGFSKFTPIFFQ